MYVMINVQLIDHKGDFWDLTWANAPQRYLHQGECYWKSWWYASERPAELKNYSEVPLPIFTDWWPQ